MRLPGSSKISDNWQNKHTEISRLRNDFTNVRHVAEQRSMTNKRLGFTIITFLLAIFLTYSSLFYFPAYTIKPSIVRVATQDGAVPSVEIDDDSQGLGNYLKLLIMRRGYLRQGQSVTASYSLDEGMRMELAISRCNKAVILEIYMCGKTLTQSVVIGNTREGRVNFTANSGGFYFFEEKVISPVNYAPKYTVSWRRYQS